MSANRQSSSLLPMNERHLRGAPDSAVTGTIEVDVARLDDLHVVRRGERAFLKIDVRGTELAVFAAQLPRSLRWDCSNWSSRP